MTDKGKVLLMDDEQVILDVTHEVLKFLGYDAVFTKEGASAIAIYKQEKEAGRPFDLVILDLSIPEGMNGREAIDQLRRYDPNVKAIVSSGYSNDPVVQNFAAYGFSGRLTKPYRINEIKNILEEMIKK
jgi:CheY-like chemotaxis protein